MAIIKIICNKMQTIYVYIFEMYNLCGLYFNLSK